MPIYKPNLTPAQRPDNVQFISVINAVYGKAENNETTWPNLGQQFFSLYFADSEDVQDRTNKWASTSLKAYQRTPLVKKAAYFSSESRAQTGCLKYLPENNRAWFKNYI